MSFDVLMYLTSLSRMEKFSVLDNDVRYVETSNDVTFNIFLIQNIVHNESSESLVTVQWKPVLQPPRQYHHAIITTTFSRPEGGCINRVPLYASNYATFTCFSHFGFL